MTSAVEPIGFVNVLLWYRGATTGTQSGRASGSPRTARVEKPRRRFTGGSRERQRDGPSGGARGEPPPDQRVEQGISRFGRAQDVQCTVGTLDQGGEPVTCQHGLDRLAVSVVD